MLTKYKKYLQSYYNARVLAPADKYLPTLHTPYINLAMISRGRHDRGERDEFTLKTLHGGVDQILESKSPKICSVLVAVGSQSGSFWWKVLQELVRVPLPGSCVGDGMR